ncbi:MAG: Gfo/Idh/MocA family oxidoreductase [Anaerolineae bacterium]|nr:Gfo/Idh/MocA family oxidoreductase [Anaerolineae bacterium]
MSVSQPTRVALIGGGNMARAHVRVMLRCATEVEVVAVAEPDSSAYMRLAEQFQDFGQPAPRRYHNHEQLLARHADELDVALISTPHAQHFEQACACLAAQLDVLLEKPMVVTAEEARALIAERDRSGRLLVVAFQGSLSPQVREAARLVQSGELGALRGVQAHVWQPWDAMTQGTWRQEPELSGGGFLFDTGAHMLNTVADVVGEDFSEVAAWLDHCGRAVDIRGTVMARTRSGALVTMHGNGDIAIRSTGSEVRIWCERGIIITGQWGERLLVQREDDDAPRAVNLPPTPSAWEQFLAVRSGKLPNPCPPEVGLRMARLWDAIRQSAAQGGAPVRL